MNNTIRIIFVILLIILILMFSYRFFNIENKILKYFFPTEYSEYVYIYSEELNIDPMLTFAIIKTESNFDKNARSKSGAIGLMQLMESTAKEQAEKLDIEYSKDILYKPEINLRLGLNYFNTLLDYYDQNYILAFTAYNAGLGNVQEWIKKGIIRKDGTDIENIPFKETSMYVRKVIRSYEIYKKLYN